MQVFTRTCSRQFVFAIVGWFFEGEESGGAACILGERGMLAPRKAKFDSALPPIFAVHVVYYYTTVSASSRVQAK